LFENLFWLVVMLIEFFNWINELSEFRWLRFGECVDCVCVRLGFYFLGAPSIGSDVVLRLMAFEIL